MSPSPSSKSAVPLAAQAVQRLVRLGYLPAQRYGRVWLVDEQDARAYQRGQRGVRRG